MAREHRYPRSYDRALRSQLEQLRIRGYAGGVISPHRALLTLAKNPYRLLGSLALVICWLLIWLMIHDVMCDGWARIMEFWRRSLGLDGYVIMGGYDLGNWFHFEVPLLRTAAAALSWKLWWGGTLVTALVFLASFFFPRRLIPYAYLLRSAAFVQVISQIFFAFVPEAFPYSLSGYLEVMLIAGFFLLPLVPVLLGFIYYIFDFSLPRRAGLTLLILAHLYVLIPMQFMVHAYLIYHGSLLFMPLLFLVFGLPLDVLVFIAFYSWGMSWRGILPRKGERAAFSRGLAVARAEGDERSPKGGSG